MWHKRREWRLPRSPAGDYSYCGALAATCNAFYAGTPTECGRAANDQCSSFQPTYSQAFQDSVVSCAKAFSPCVANFHDCIRDTTANARPTEAQAKVRDDFCAVCPDKPETGTVGPCSTFFTKDADAGIGIYGVGAPILKVNDSIAAEIGAKCIGISFSADGGIVSHDPDAGAGPSHSRRCLDDASLPGELSEDLGERAVGCVVRGVVIQQGQA